MPAKYYTILTKTGEALHANAQIMQTAVPWTHMAIGDGGGAPVNPTQEQTALVHEVARVPITSVEAHPENPNWIVAEAVIPNDVGGWVVRETAIMGTPGGAQCIAVGNYPDTYKPVLAEGSVREMVLRMVVAVIGADTVNLTIDPAVAIASRGWVEGLTATTERRGIVELATLDEAAAGTDGERAITPAALRKVVPKAAHVRNDADANVLRETGLYYFNRGTNGPKGELNGWVRHSHINEDNGYQEAFWIEGGFFRRELRYGVWKEWKEVPNQDAIEALDNAIDQKEDAISAGGEGTYFAGNKTWKPTGEIIEGLASEQWVQEQTEDARGMAQTYAVTPLTYKGWLIAVTSPHYRIMVWNTATNSYTRAPFHRPGGLQYFMRHVPAGFLEVRSDVVYNTADFPDLAEYLGVVGPTFILDETRGEFLRTFDSGRGVDPGRSPGGSQGDAIRNITGNRASSIIRLGEVFSGAYNAEGTSGDRSAVVGSGFVDGVTVTFDASRVVPTANENRPRNCAYRLAVAY